VGGVGDQVDHHLEELVADGVDGRQGAVEVLVQVGLELVEDVLAEGEPLLHHLVE
jgi:hypothetical protein